MKNFKKIDQIKFFSKKLLNFWIVIKHEIKRPNGLGSMDVTQNLPTFFFEISDNNSMKKKILEEFKNNNLNIFGVESWK